MRTLMIGTLALLVGSTLMAQEVPTQDYFEIPDLQLVSYEALPDGTPSFTGPVASAIVLAWFAEHGYPALLGDLNEDGVVDELDTAILAERLATTMAVRGDRPANDPHLVDAVAEYVSQRYPDEFVLKIFDSSFAREYQRVFGKPFQPSDYPRIAIELKANADHADYTGELLAAEGVVVGLGEEQADNTYFVGRSFGRYEQPNGWPIDLVDTSDDPFVRGAQGQVLDTLMRLGPDHWLVNYGGWKPLEFMLSLSPLREPSLGTPTGPCPENNIGYHVVTVPTEYGTFTVEECVVRDGDRDLYIYTITNIDYLYEGCGLCHFFLPNFHGFSTLDQWGPDGWLFNVWGDWSWTAPLGDCGILPGQMAEMGFAVPGPTEDTWQQAAVWSCAQTSPVTKLDPRPVKTVFRTTGPGPQEEEGCPDLVIRDLTACWRYSASQEMLIDVTAVVANIGTEQANTVWVCLSADSVTQSHYLGTINAGSSVTASTTINVGSAAGGVLFPINVTAFADCVYLVDECREDNNTASTTVAREDSCH